MTNDGVGLPVRLHHLLLAMAGRVDDDALSLARELLAVGELDRSVELLTGTLLAGRIPVTPGERDHLAWLLGELRSDPGLIDRLPVVEAVPVPRHRFTGESDPSVGVADALARAVSVLPDVRAVRCVWRSSPAGATPGPLPQRVVLVDIGPQGFAPATAYRIDSVLRRSGVRAAVEVLAVGTQLSEYHAAAVTNARAVPVNAPPRAETPAPEAAAWFDGSADEVRDPAPAAEPTPAPEPVEATGSRRSRATSFEGAQPFPPKPVKRIPVREPEPVAEPVAEVVAEEEEPPPPPFVEAPLPVRAEVTTELGPDELAQLRAALADEPTAPEVPSSVDANLSERERALLQQLHEELAQREKVGPPKSTDTGRWQVDRSSARQSAFGAAGNNGHPPFPPAG